MSFKRWVGCLAGSGALLLLPLAVCSAPRPTSKPAPRAAADAPVLGHLVLKGRKVTLKAGGLVSVRTLDGQVVAEDITLEQLRAVDPVLQASLARTMAAGHPGLQWAGREPRAARLNVGDRRSGSRRGAGAP